MNNITHISKNWQPIKTMAGALFDVCFAIVAIIGWYHAGGALAVLFVFFLLLRSQRAHNSGQSLKMMR